MSASIVAWSVPMISSTPFLSLQHRTSILSDLPRGRFRVMIHSDSLLSHSTTVTTASSASGCASCLPSRRLRTTSLPFSIRVLTPIRSGLHIPYRAQLSALLASVDLPEPFAPMIATEPRPPSTRVCGSRYDRKSCAVIDATTSRAIAPPALPIHPYRRARVPPRSRTDARHTGEPHRPRHRSRRLHHAPPYPALQERAPPPVRLWPADRWPLVLLYVMRSSLRAPCLVA